MMGDGLHFSRTIPLHNIICDGTAVLNQMLTLPTKNPIKWKICLLFCLLNNDI